jgi:solute:Na+ symporter, SSS family
LGETPASVQHSLLIQTIDVFMGFSTTDYLIVGIYLAIITIWGAIVSRNQHTAVDYFLGGKQMKWWTVGLSIVASETSTLTFVSVPGLAYNGDMHFLQLAFGYFIGRILVSIVFIPAFYKGNLETAYDFLGKRFGLSLRKFASSVFLVTRVLASGVRLFATAIPVHLITGLNYVESISLIGFFALIYTYAGGLKAVVTMDVVQLCIYLCAAIASLVLILHRLPGGWSDVVRFAHIGGADKFEIINSHWGNNIAAFLSEPYTLVGSILGGTFLTMASHGTDQLLVQRLLGCKSKRDSQRALLLDAGCIVLQFAFFLILGVCLFAFFGGKSLQQLGVSSSDEVFPKFIVEYLPTGIAGLAVAGILASAMGTLSSSISSLASSTYLDLFSVNRRRRLFSSDDEMKGSRFFTLLWGIALVGGAMLFTNTHSPVIEIGLKIASVTYGGLLGTFFLGLLSKRIDQKDSYAGFITGIIVMTAVLGFTTIDFTWDTLIGCIVTISVGNLIHVMRKKFVATF